MDTDTGLFGPGSVTWKVHAEPILFLAGLRALFLQALHPRAVAGVMQNSNFKQDPWGRLMRTVNYVGTVIYGTTPQAHAAGRRVRRLHARLRAMDTASGEEFRIDAQNLLLWVHVSEVESFMDTALRAGVRLTPDEVDRYYDEQRIAAALVGLPNEVVPGSAAEVEAYYRAVQPELRMTRDAAETLAFLLVPRLPFNLGFTPARAAYSAIAATAFGLLPPWARRLYGLPGLPSTDLSATLSARALRLGLKAIPGRLLEGPMYKAAMARAGA
jgi:uncharacterized protein (DUF2236 family)